MKLAVCGGGPLAIEACLHFNDLEAYVRGFYKGLLGGKIVKLADSYPDFPLGKWKDITTPLGRSVSSLEEKVSDLEAEACVEEYWTLYLSSLIKSLNSSNIFRPYKAERVHKRFLSLDDEVGGSRLKDLFRVVYKSEPSTEIIDQMNLNPEAFEKMGEELKNSFLSGLEQYEDFDLVIDSAGIESRYGGTCGVPTLNELSLAASEQVIYGYPTNHLVNKLKGSSKKIAIVGSGFVAALWLIKLWPVVKETRSQIQFVFKDENIFSGIFEKFPTLGEDLALVLSEEKELFESSCRDYEKHLRKWRELDTAERLKVRAPLEPKKLLSYFPKSVSVAMDKLIDRDEIFLSIEKMDCDQVVEAGDCTTLGIDQIIVANGFCHPHHIYQNMRTSFDQLDGFTEGPIHPEPGFYSLASSRFSLVDGLKDLEVISENVLSFFKRREP